MKMNILDKDPSMFEIIIKNIPYFLYFTMPLQSYPFEGVTSFQSENLRIGIDECRAIEGLGNIYLIGVVVDIN